MIEAASYHDEKHTLSTPEGIGRRESDSYHDSAAGVRLLVATTTVSRWIPSGWRTYSYRVYHRQSGAGWEQRVAAPDRETFLAALALWDCDDEWAYLPTDDEAPLTDWLDDPAD